MKVRSKRKKKKVQKLAQSGVLLSDLGDLREPRAETMSCWEGWHWVGIKSWEHRLWLCQEAWRCVFDIFTIESECPNAWQKGLSCFVTSLTWCFLAASWILGGLWGHSCWMVPAEVESCSSRTRETWNVINLWWFKLGRSEQQGCGGSFWISAQQESPESKRERSLWGSWLAAHTGVGGFVGILGAPFLGMMEHSSEMPKPALTRADPGNGTRPCPAKSVNQLDESSPALLEWIREWNRS